MILNYFKHVSSKFQTSFKQTSTRSKHNFSNDTNCFKTCQNNLKTISIPVSNMCQTVSKLFQIRLTQFQFQTCPNAFQTPFQFSNRFTNTLKRFNTVPTTSQTVLTHVQHSFKIISNTSQLSHHVSNFSKTPSQ